MSSAQRGRPRPPQALNLVLAYLAFVPLAIIWASFSWIMLTTSGASSMAALMPMAAFLFTSWLWVLLAIIALARSARYGGNAHALVVSLAALLLAVLGLFFMLPR
ncbi:hypothetical protein QE374_002353 [Microbacterium sp. SORGH_AS428]|uniref:hypothetical protein n=1 Tax=Microbacterium sp. SORGH_AS_0428 TaxID=3041788 RepID=UPI00285835B5|nr:hypothetical protein [Microbacterium sp. SORGH_AS_0428]MDR6200444.1 hypothetical protein [Microbacterium sp. SORGH_AS_0428]